MLGKKTMLTVNPKGRAVITCMGAMLFMGACSLAKDAPDGQKAGAEACSQQATTWRLVYHETFDTPFAEPAKWSEDLYGKQSPYHVDDYDEDGEVFFQKGGDTFTKGLKSFRSFRKSHAYGKDGWLTVEQYGRDSDKDGIPETGGRFVADNGKAKLICLRHFDGAILRSTRALPNRYRVEVTVSNIRFGGKRGDSWSYDGKTNGYDGNDGPEMAGPWRFSGADATPLRADDQNGVYFLCIVDYARPAPHNNVFIHHHRKVVMDTDNNTGQWTKVWNPRTQKAEVDGSHLISMIWLNGEKIRDDWGGNAYLSYTPDGFKSSTVLVDKYLDDEAYTFSIERDGESYAMSVSGRFFYGGVTTYRASRKFRERPVTWHYNQTPSEYGEPCFNEEKTIGAHTFDTWPMGSSYPDYFFFGDPHINFYEGTAEFDDVKLYLLAK